MREAWLGRTLFAAGAVVTVTFSLAPFLFMVLMGFADRPDFLGPAAAGGGVPFEPTFAHWRAVLFSDASHFPAYLLNSLVVAGASAGLTVAVASPAAYAITRLPLPGKAAVLVFVLAVSMFPPVSLLGWLFEFMSALGWINTWPALVFPYVAWSLPLALWILVSYFRQIPLDLDDAARVDGCTRTQVLVRVVLPLAAPGVFSTALLAFVFAFNEFLFALLLTTDYSARTVPVGIALFEGLHGELPWGEIMAAATITTVPIVALTLAFQRRIVQGLTRGAVKG